MRGDVARYGVMQVSKDMFLRAVNRLMFLKVYRCLKLEQLSAEAPSPAPGYRGEFLDRGFLRKYATLPEYEIAEDFLEQAFIKGDRCYGWLKGDLLCGYQWYSNGPTDTGWHGLMVNFDARYTYMYKAFTHPAHRGKRLFPAGVEAMFKESCSLGYNGIVTLVETNNPASLHSCRLLGFVECGTLYAAAIANHCFCHADSAARKAGFLLTRMNCSTGKADHLAHGRSSSHPISY